MEIKDLIAEISDLPIDQQKVDFELKFSYEPGNNPTGSVKIDGNTFAIQLLIESILSTDPLLLELFQDAISQINNNKKQK